MQIFQKHKKKINKLIKKNKLFYGNYIETIKIKSYCMQLK